jgi:hypothetical protein
MTLPFAKTMLWVTSWKLPLVASCMLAASVLMFTAPPLMNAGPST